LGQGRIRAPRPLKLSSPVKPLAPALEQHRRDRAREHIKQARKARNYDTPVNWWEHGR
jgi:hypothetical protein